MTTSTPSPPPPTLPSSSSSPSPLAPSVVKLFQVSRKACSSTFQLRVRSATSSSSSTESGSSGTYSTSATSIRSNTAENNNEVAVATVGGSQASLVDHPIHAFRQVRYMFGSATTADFHILLGHNSVLDPLLATQAGFHTIFFLHMATMALSPFMQYLMDAMVYQQQNGFQYIHVAAGPAFNAYAFMAFSEALRALYGAPLVSHDWLFDIVTQFMGVHLNATNINVVRVRWALCYATSGIFLGRMDVANRGIDLAMSLMAWDTVEILIDFGMAPHNYFLTCRQMKDVTRNASLNFIKEFEKNAPKNVLHEALQFIGSFVTPNFHSSAAAFPPAFGPSPELDLTDERLEYIHFGGRPSLADLASRDPVARVASAMLLTLPFDIFARLVGIMNVHYRVDEGLLREVVRYREQRRLKAIEAWKKRVWPTQPLYEDGLEELANEEVVAVSEEGVPSVFRRRVGLKHPQML
ncbi:hypothetical protein N7532_000478 [Penicillium argentinense]|uniref:Uncharacterized protein n=1 Tax=Penicillium argentinense TaxID=1131581 RepID=A0A9W9G5F4_9EURO|nr:uncharacterized protein N7532_000478 [Penicillium argentinense]KAJ5112433.1 hypothetical protein N7532_000478 [Penicillium argentinense]